MWHVVISSLGPVMLLIALGAALGRWQWVSPEGAKELSRLAFSVFGPALLFRTMSQVDPASLVWQPLAVYLGTAVLMYWGFWLRWGRSLSAAMWAMATMFSNTVALGIPLVGYVYGQPGLVVLFTLISVHSLVLVTMITVLLEWQRAQQAHLVPNAPGQADLRAVLVQALRQSIFHPVPLPILLGLAFFQTGWSMPEALDRALQWLGAAFGPIALLLVGINLAQLWRVTAADQTTSHPWRKALELTLLKNLLFPIAVAVVGWSAGLPHLPLSVMVLAAALPVGANVFLVSQSYALEREAITLGMSLSTLLGMISLPVVMVLLQMSDFKWWSF
ncbi:MAG: AEC family transporter [Betaproteobacteria bacterium]|nr:AEC family transporter [Betaproteobacteria bacterium]